MNRINDDFARAIDMVMRPSSQEIARSLVTKLAAEVDDLRKKEKLTPQELHQLKRLRMLSKTIKI